MSLEFRKGGKLIYQKWVYVEELGEGHYEEVDMSEGLEWLHKRDLWVTFDPDVTLRDLLLFVEREPEVCDIVFTNCFIKEFVEEFKLVKDTPVPVIEYDPDGVEYLEIYWCPEYREEKYSHEEKAPVLEGFSRARFHGIGFELKEDKYDGDWKMYSAGHRISWGIDFMPLEETLYLPVRLNTEFKIYDDWQKPMYKMRDISPRDVNVLIDAHREYTFEEAMQAVFWEISFYGGPAGKKEQKEELDAIMDDLDLDNNSIEDLKAKGKIVDVDFCST